jgi:MFS family permease
MPQNKTKFWTAPVIMLMITESSIVYHMDFYSAAIPAWFLRMGFGETKFGIFYVVGLTSGVAMGFMCVGGLVAGPLLDRYSPRKVQFLCLSLMIVTAWWTDKIDGWAEMMLCQCIRDFACSVGIIACGMRARRMLPPDEESQLRGLARLNVWSCGLSAFFALIAPFVVVHSVHAWFVVGSYITTWGWLETLFTWHYPEMREDKNTDQHTRISKRDTLLLVLPSIGVSIAQGVVMTYVIIDVGVTMGAPVRAMINVAAGLSGLVIPLAVARWGDKHVVRGLMLVALCAVPGLVWSTWYTLIFVGLAVGFAQIGLSMLLTVKRPNTGSSVSMHAMVDYGGAISGSTLWGVARQSIGVAPAYALLGLPLLVCYFFFERLFRSKRWEKQV